MINLEISKMAKPTVIGLFNVTRCLALCTIVKSLFMISACRNDGRLKALDKTIGSQMRCRFKRFLTCSIVLLNVALACSLARSDSKLESAFFRAIFNPWFKPAFLLKRSHPMNFLEYEPVANVEL